MSYSKTATNLLRSSHHEATTPSPISSRTRAQTKRRAARSARKDKDPISAASARAAASSRITKRKPAETGVLQQPRASNKYRGAGGGGKKKKKTPLGTLCAQRLKLAARMETSAGRPRRKYWWKREALGELGVEGNIEFLHEPRKPTWSSVEEMEERRREESGMWRRSGLRLRVSDEEEGEEEEEDSVMGEDVEMDELDRELLELAGAEWW